MKKGTKLIDLQKQLSELEKDIEQTLANTNPTKKKNDQLLWAKLKTYKKLLFENKPQPKNTFENLDKNVENLTGWFWAIDNKYKLISANTAFINSLSQKVGKVLKKGDSIFPKDLENSVNDQWKKLYDRAFKGETFQIEIKSRFSKQKSEIYNYNFSPLRNENFEILGISIWGVDVTKHYELEQKLKDSESKLLAVLNNTPDIIARFDLDLKHLYVSNNIETATGIPAKNFLGKTNEELGMPEENVKSWNQILTEVINSGLKKSIEFNFESPTGKRYFHSILNPEFDKKNSVKSVLVYTRNITEIRKVEKSLIKSEEKHRSITNDILDSSKTGIVILDKNFKVVWINKAIEKFYGLKKKQIIGHDKRKLISQKIKHLFENSKEYEEKLLNAYQKNSYYEYYECKIVKGSNRKERWLEHWSQPIESGLYKGGRVEQYFDISERVNMKHELEEAKMVAEEANILKSAFLANTSHEIRTPLNSLLGFTELLNELNIYNEEASKYLNIIENSGNQLLGIVNDIIDISKIDANQLRINNDSLNPNRIMEDLYDTYNSYIRQKEKKSIQLKYIKNESFNQNIRTDALRLKQIMDNLLSNALKFTDSGTVEFGFETKQNQLHFFVKDTGPGISKKHMKNLFTRFARFHGKEGTGLGLCISKNLTEMLGGHMQVQSKENVGSEFRFYIPLVLA
ncbi:PAS domain-containing sensor histidine kinase [Sunxiuqinia sp. A32]|uniref:PAS domain-containing sensor histidine kinase n=1 Tax=Sunxiuqinia sp. A32 TaxID=3461496 RepID=UPI004046857D